MSTGICLVTGVRPHFIKARMLLSALRGLLPDTHIDLVHTGQHASPEMSVDFLDPQSGLRLTTLPLPMQDSRRDRFRAATSALCRFLQKRRPEMVVVFGDADSSLIGAAAAVCRGIPIVHAESGPRLKNSLSPEQINRIVIETLADMLLCPTPTALNNLRHETRSNMSTEGFERCLREISGFFPSEVLQDMRNKARLFSDSPNRKHAFFTGDLLLDAYLADVYGLNPATEKKAPSLPENYALMTLHRAENTDCPTKLQGIVENVSRLGREIAVVFPVHPRTRQALRKAGMPEEHMAGIRTLPPASRSEMLSLLRNSSLVLTDSGGLQREAFFAGKRSVILREESEWKELETEGWSIIAGSAGYGELREKVRKALARPEARPDTRPFGSGSAAQSMAACIKGYYSRRLTSTEG